MSSFLSSAQNNVWNNFAFTGSLRPFPRTYKPIVPSHIAYPDYANDVNGYPDSEVRAEGKKIHVCNDSEILKMKKVSQLAREVLDVVSTQIREGITTEEIDQIVLHECIIRESYPSPLNYYKFPSCCCTSINEIVCHGIPDSRPLEDGDIVNVDVTLYHDGYHGDLNETFIIGQPSDSDFNLLKITHECLMKGIGVVKPGVPYNKIGEVIEEHAVKNGYSVVRNYTGHGIHQYFHCPPTVRHCNNYNTTLMKEGHVFTIEPMINEGTEKVIEWPDEWTVATKDGKRSAQFEQTLLVTKNGCEILTARKDNPLQPYFLDFLLL
ncbi:Methionine aminopeptidase 1 [Thelohanellus kitauei]|uniref:Methionine aminopeptidase n=1 Tax=Thelohanellus kitauei TaxID=669202 RepID=A0A0C2JHF1_THEKT|nr:Methionine aminopeptidase 1 [Thelohanellus kitauei]